MQRLAAPFRSTTVVRVLLGAAVTVMLVFLGLSPRPVDAGYGEQLPGSVPSAVSQAPSSDASALRIGMVSSGQTLSYNPYAPAGYVFSPWAQLTLAQLSAVPSNKLRNEYFYPELASSWSLGKSVITIHLRPSAKWQDGRPLTSADVVDSLLLAGEDFNPGWSSILAVRPTSPHTVVIDLRPNSVALNTWTDLVQVPIVPGWQYRRLVPSGAQRAIVQYWSLYKAADPSQASIAAANNSAGGKKLATLAAAIPKFSPSRLIGDGPFELERANSTEVLLQKWSGFWQSRNIHVPVVELMSMSDAGTTFGDLMGGRMDYEGYTIFSDPEIEELNKSQYGHYLRLVLPENASVLLFHLADYPYNLLKVRKALAYLVDRPKLAHLESGGTFEQNQPVTVPDGLTVPMNQRYLTKQQLNSLPHYSYSPEKATSLLESVGFRKRNGTWYTGKGKPFAITLYVEAGQERFDADALAITAMLRQAGIKASADEVQAAVFKEQQLAGGYPLSLASSETGSLNPLDEIEETLITYNYSVAGEASSSTGSGEAAIGIGPDAQVPGLGKVNIASQLSRELATATPNQWSKYVWDWARFQDEQLPTVPMTSTNFHILWSTSRYTDWPPPSFIRTAAADMVLWMQYGYLRLRNGT